MENPPHSFQSKTAHSKAVVSLRYRSNGMLIASASADKSAKLLSCGGDSLEVVTSLNGHSLGLNDCAWIQDRYLATASDDKLVMVWDVETGTCISTSSGHKSFVYSLAVDPRTDIIYSGGVDGSIRAIDVRQGAAVLQIESHADTVTSLNVHPQGKELMSSSLDGNIRLWDPFWPGLCTMTLVGNEKDGQRPISCASYSPNGRYILCGTMDSSLSIHSFVDKCQTRCLRRFEGHKNVKYSLNSSFWSNRSRDFVISSSEDSCIHLWGLNTNRRDSSEKVSPIDSHRKLVGGHSDAVLCVAGNPTRDGHQCVSGSISGVITCWNDVS